MQFPKELILDFKIEPVLLQLCQKKSNELIYDIFKGFIKKSVFIWDLLYFVYLLYQQISWILTFSW